MSKTIRKFLVMLLVLTVTMAFSGMSAFAYTAVDDDGNRDTVNDTSMHIVYSTSGMLRINDEGTYAVLSEDGKTVTVHAETSLSKTWGKITKLAFIEETATDEEKDNAAKEIKFEDSNFYDKSMSRTLTFTIPVEDVGKKIPVCRYVSSSDQEGKWTAFSEQQYYIVEKSKVLPATLGIENTVGMFKPEAATLDKTEDGFVLHLTMGSESYSKVFLGYASEAKDDEALAINIVDGKGYVDIPIAKFDTPMVLAFRGSSKYYNRTMTVSYAKGKVFFEPTQISLTQFDEMTLEEALARAAADTSVETVNALIEAIQVQYRDDNTDKYCAIARAYYDALSKNDKAKLADPGYFGDDTGDASLDDPLNEVPDKKNELLVVSFGTSFNDSRVATIGAIEKALAAAYGEEYAVRRAFTAQIIINHVQARDGEKIDNVAQAMDKAVAAGVERLVVQPTHLMSGAEYDELKETIDAYSAYMDIVYAKPLLNSDEDKEAIAKAVVAAAAEEAGFTSVEEAVASQDTAFVFMGHGTAHDANVTYTQMQKTMDNLGYKNCFVGTVEGIPAETALPEVKKAVDAKGYTKVVLRPLMVVAGDHANNDMAADEEGSWYYGFANGGEFEVEGAEDPVDIGEGLGADNVSCQIKGLGEIPAVQQIYVEHTAAVKDEEVPSIDVYLTVSDMGQIAKANDGSYMANKALAVKDLDNDGKYTFDEALTVAHAKFNSLDGYDKGTYGVTKLWGVETSNCLFIVNNEGISTGVTVDTVKAGDHLTASINKDNTYYADWYVYFEDPLYAPAPGDEVTLTLKGHLGMAYTEEEKKNVPIAGATVKTIDGTVVGTTDEEGKVTFTAPDAIGEYVYTADGTVESTATDWSTYEQVTVDCPIIAPAYTLKVVTPEEAKASAIAAAKEAEAAQKAAEEAAAAAAQAQKDAEQAAADAAEAQKKAEEAQKAAEEKQKAAEEAQKAAEEAQKKAEDQAAADKAAKEAADKAAAEAKTAQEAAEKAATEAKTAQDDADTKLAEAIAAKEAAEKAAEEAKAEAEKAKLAQKKAEAKNYTVKGLKVTSKGRKFTVKYKKNKNATGYQIKYKLKTDKKYKTLKTLKKLKFTSKKLKKGKVYQFKVRTYTLVNGKKVYGKWTAVKTVKCK